MDRRLRVGVAGLGVGRGHAETFLALADRFELVAVCDADEAKANALAAALAVPTVCRDFTELCAISDLDVVDICTPSFLHFAQTQEALAAGKHVILEKPVAGSLREVDELIAAEARSGKRVLPIFQYRFGHGAQKLRYLVQQGIAGQAFVATTETHWRRRDAYYAAWHGRWERELGGPIVTLAVHAHDVITSILGPGAQGLCDDGDARQSHRDGRLRGGDAGNGERRAGHVVGHHRLGQADQPHALLFQQPDRREQHRAVHADLRPVELHG